MNPTYDCLQDACEHARASARSNSGMTVRTLRRIGREHVGMWPRAIHAALVELGKRGYIRRMDDVINRIAVPAQPPG